MKIDLNNLKIFRLGNGWFQKIRLIYLFSYLKFQKMFRANGCFRCPKELRLRYQDKDFSFFVKCILDFHLLREMFVDEQYADARSIKPKPSTILDLGSNIGASIIYFKLLFPDAKVMGVEPNPACHEVLEMNTKQFGDSVRIAKYGIGSETGEADFFLHPEHWSASVYKRGGSETPVKVKIVSLEKVLSDFGQARVDLLKMDIEGAEYDMLKYHNQKLQAGYLLGELHPTIAKDDADGFYQHLRGGYEIIRDQPAGNHRHIFLKFVEEH